MLRMRQFAAMAGLAAMEAWRQPIFVLLTTTAVALTTLCPLLMLFHFGEEGKLARDSGLAFQFLFGLLVAVHGACRTLSGEMGEGTASAVLSKPVGRAAFFLAKFAGLVAVLCLFSLCTGLATLLSARISEKFSASAGLFGYVTDWQTDNMLLAAPCLALAGAALLNYLKRRPFGSTASALLLVAVLAVLIIAGFFDRSGMPARYDLQVHWRLVPASALVLLALVVLAAFTLGLSTRFGPVPTLAFSLGIFALGLISDHLFGRAAAGSAPAAVLYALLPNWQHFWVSDGLDNGGAIPAGYVLRAAAYAATCAAGALCLGVLSFRHADMK